MMWEEHLELAERAARKAGRLLMETFLNDPRVTSSEGKDVKTRADVDAEECIVQELAATGLPVVAEETASLLRRPEGPYWLVDPLDGTLNFTRGFPVHAVSIGLWEDDRPRIGVIHDLPRGAVYKGVVDQGAWCDSVRIRVSPVADRTQAVLATGFPSYRDYTDESLLSFVRQVQAFKKIRMIGSAALSLAMVARGVFEAYAEEEILLWDVAAGLALVDAAGGTIEIEQGRTTWSVRVTATNGRIKM